VWTINSGRRWLEARKPAADGAAMGLVEGAEGGAGVGLFVEDDEEVGEEKPRQSEEQNGGRLFEEAEARDGKEGADGVARDENAA
jgi:hypothetical protein